MDVASNAKTFFVGCACVLVFAVLLCLSTSSRRIMNELL